MRFKNDIKRKYRECFSFVNLYLIIVDTFTYMIKKMQRLFGFGKSAKRIYRYVDFAISQPAIRVARRLTKKGVGAVRPHPCCLENDRSIDREEHATISARDLLALVQLGEICENACANIGTPGSSVPAASVRPMGVLFSFESNFNQR